MSPYERGRKGNAFREGARRLPHEGNAGLGQRGSGRLAVTGLVNWETGGATIRTSLQGKPTTLGCMCASTYCKLHGVWEGLQRNHPSADTTFGPIHIRDPSWERGLTPRYSPAEPAV